MTFLMEYRRLSNMEWRYLLIEAEDITSARDMAKLWVKNNAHKDIECYVRNTITKELQDMTKKQKT